MPNGAPNRRWFVSLATFDAHGGETINLNIGGAGLGVTGRLVLPNSSGWMVRRLDRAEQRILEVRGVRVFEDGRFRAAELEPGEYKLGIQIPSHRREMNAAGAG